MGSETVTRIARLHTRLRPTDSPSTIYAALADGLAGHVMLTFTARVYRELRQELCSDGAAAQWAQQLAARLGRPVLFNVDDKGGSSHTFAIAAPGWSNKRLQGYVAGRHAELEQAFGKVSRLWNPDEAA